jgi:nucleotide-binding universal stress UspA family protein
MSTSIVCGIDGSGGAWRAVSVAAALARALDVRAVMLHVMEDGHTSAFGSPRRTVRARGTRRRVEAIVEEYCFQADTGLHVRAGDPARELLLVAAQENAELLVVASGRQGPGGAALVGGVASALMRKSPCPVVVVPRDVAPPAEARIKSSVVCAVENEETDVYVLRLATDLARRLGGSLQVVIGCAEAEVAPQTPPGDAPLSVAREEAGVIVVGPPGQRAPGSIDGCDLALRVVAEACAPVVVLPPHATLDPGSGHYELEQLGHRRGLGPRRRPDAAE